MGLATLNLRSCASFARRSRPEATGSTWEFCGFGQAPPRRPTPGSIASVTIRSFSARDHPRRRSTDVITSICVFVIYASTKPSTPRAPVTVTPRIWTVQYQVLTCVVAAWRTTDRRLSSGDHWPRLRNSTPLTTRVPRSHRQRIAEEHICQNRRCTNDF
jgi:hypothetical protein